MPIPRSFRLNASRAQLWTSSLAAVLTLCGSPPAHAQPDRPWLVVPALVADGGDVSPLPRRAVEWLERGLPSHGVAVITGRQARARFEQRGSSAPMMATHSDLDALARDAQQALYHVASGLPTRARQDVERALARAGAVIESLNRETRAAQHLLDACLYLVRAQLESGHRDEAREQALQCRRLVPDIEPDGTMHPPDVIGVLAEAEAHLRQREPGSIRVESSPSGCSVYVNGRMLGTSPLELPDLGPGEYRVQVECREGQLGRVHRTVLAAGRVVKRIDTRFDSALQTALDASLQYGSYVEQARFAVDHAAEVGRVVGATDVVLASAVEPTDNGVSGALLLRRLRGSDGDVVAAVKLHLGEDGEVKHGHGARAIAALRDGRFSDLTEVDAAALSPLDYEATPGVDPAVAALVPGGSAPDVELGSTHEPSAADGDSDEINVDGVARSEGPSVFGWALAGVGTAAIAGSWALYGYQLTLEADYHASEPLTTEYYTALNRVDRFQFVPLAVGFAGAALTAVSLPLVLPEHDGAPVWAWVAGGAGLVTAAVGAYFLYAGTQCDEFDPHVRRCTNDLFVTYFGGMLALTAAPLLAVPVVYLTRGTPVQDSQVSVAASARSLVLSWKGSL